MKYLLFIFLFCSIIPGLAKDDPANYYWIGFADKKGTTYTINHPEEFLSNRSLLRRQKQRIPIDELDIPVSQNYLDSLRSKGATIIHQSKWLNGVTILATEQQYNSIVSTFGFIRESELTKPGLILKYQKNKFKEEHSYAEIDTSYYGYSVFQVGQLNGHFLHEQDYLGQGMQIAILDAGFYKADELPAFETLYSENRILGTRDFVDPGTNVYQKDDHGMNVLSTMAGELPGFLIGTAPKASYYLIRSEDAVTEYLIEEDNWVVAAEYADSLGVDIINSSLGYYLFNDENMNHSYADMDGKTTRVTKAANIAFQKGMLVFASAGNEANDPWHYIIAPADGDQVIAVGAVDKNRQWAPFSSVGPSSDNDVKPNLAAMGLASIVQKNNGDLAQVNGTSFSSPILAGMSACLWQAFPNATNRQIKNALEKSASQYSTPDTLTGYGIPDFKQAFSILKNSIATSNSNKLFAVKPNPFHQEVQIYPQNGYIPKSDIRVALFQMNGKTLYQKVFTKNQSLNFGNLANLPDGFYIIAIESSGNTEFHKVVKISIQ